MLTVGPWFNLLSPSTTRLNGVGAAHPVWHELAKAPGTCPAGDRQDEHNKRACTGTGTAQVGLQEPPALLRGEQGSSAAFFAVLFLMNKNTDFKKAIIVKSRSINVPQITFDGIHLGH